MSNPYQSSPKYRYDGPWFDVFIKHEHHSWLVFWGDELLAQVENEQQCRNLMKYLEQSSNG